MILCLDVGNSQIYGGVYENGELKFQFRKTSTQGATSDEMGIFLRDVLRENGYDHNEITQIGFCSVVPDLIYSLKNCFKHYFGITPFAVGPGAKTGLNIKYRNPLEVGADRIATAIAGSNKFPNENLIIIDFGTATTFCAVRSNKDYLGGAILPGLKISMQALESKTAKLPKVEIKNPGSACGKSTVESIQSGLYYGNLGMVKELTKRMTDECFNGKKPTIIGTGGFARLYEDSGIFDTLVSDLVLAGIYDSIILNSKN